MNEDTNSIVWEYLSNQSVLTAIVPSTRIMSPRLAENTDLPALSFFTRGGTSTPYIPGLINPSVQFDCWGITPMAARQVYRALYDVLQGVQRQVVTVDGSDYIIWSAIEEVQGQDMNDVDIPKYFRVLSFFSFMIKAE